MRKTSLTLIERFNAKFSVTPGCWNWTAATRKGYGAFQLNRTTTRGAHRVSYQLFVGEIAPGMLVCHKCDNPRCVNPDHLFLGTPKDNMRDMACKGRKVCVGARGEKSGAAKLKEADVRKIFHDGRSSRKIAAEYGVGKTIVNNIKNKTKWGHLWER